MRNQLTAVAATVALTVGLPALSASAAIPNLTYAPDPSWWGTNDRVTDILPVGDRVYIAGGFDYVGPTTGYGVGVDAMSGAKAANAPLIDGPVYAAVPDGSGGWYVAGDFKHVGGVYRPRAAQVTAAGAVTRWNPKPNAPAYALAVAGSSVLFGGDFTALGNTGGSATRLGAVDRTTGAAVSGWSASTDKAVRSLVVSGSSVYAAGDFTSVNGSARGGVVRLNATNGVVDGAFAGRTSGSVKAAVLSPDGATLYVGGLFTSAGNGGSSSGRNRLAAFSTSAGSVLPWAPSADGSVLALATDAATGNVYAGGLFGTVNGVGRAKLAGIGSDGNVLGFDAGLNSCNTPHTTKYAHVNPPCTPEVDSLAVANNTLYAGGRFGQSFSTSRHDAAAFSLPDGGLAGWNPVASNRIFTLAASGSNLFVGGELTSVNGAVRKGIAALSADTGALDPTFNADTNDMVLDMVLSPDGSRLYFGGHFTTVRGQTRNRLASVLTTDGTPDPAFKPAPNNDVLNVGVANNSLYIGGQFKRVGQILKNHAAKLSLVDGSVDPAFKADTVGPSGRLRANGMVQTMQVAPDGTKVYLGGPFETVNGTARRGIAVVNALTGALLPNQLGGIQSCFAGGDWVTRLYLSPDGKRLYGGDLCPDYVYQWDAVNLSASKVNGLNWMTRCNGGMQGTLEVNGNFYYGTHGGDRGRGGYCWASPTNHTNVSQQRYFVFDGATGTLLPDHPEFDTAMGVWSFAAVRQGLLVGGDFTFAGASDRTHQGLALFPGTP